MTTVQTTTVRAVTDVVTKGTTPTSLGRPFTQRGIRFIKVETITPDGRLLPEKVAFIDLATHNLLRRSQLREGDILFSIAGALGRSAVVEASWLPANTNQAFSVIRPSQRSHLLPRYLLWALRSEAVQRRISEINVQAAQANLSLEQVRDFAILVTGETQQRRIVEMLDDADDLVSALEVLIAKKEAMKLGMMQQLLTGKTRLPGFTEPWRSTTAGTVGVFKGGSGFPVRYQGAKSGQYPFFKVSDMNNPGNELFMTTARNYVSEQRRKQMGAVRIPADSIVFAKVGAAVFLERKRILAQASCIDNNMAAMDVDRAVGDVRFIHYALSNFAMSALVATTALPSLNGGQLRSIPLELPTDLSEQRAVAAVLSDVDDDIDTLQARLRKTVAVKRGMMQELLTGRTRISLAKGAA